MYLIALNKVVAVVDAIKISPVQTFYETFLRLTPFSFNVRVFLLWCLRLA